MKKAKKSLGQNFLIDKNIINKILSLTKIKDKNIVEIGPGKGALTDEIIKKKPKTLLIIEKDNLMFDLLIEKYSRFRNVKVINADILKFDLEKNMKTNTIIFGNLPYNISSQILVKLIKFETWPPKFSNLILMFQKELGEKIIGKFPSSKYGRLSIISNYRLENIEKFIVSENCFFPKPKVKSMVINFKPKKNTFKIKNISNLEKITNFLFSKKRKMINKSIIKILNKDEIKQIPELKTNLRPSDISPNVYYKITQIFEEN